MDSLIFLISSSLFSAIPLQFLSFSIFKNSPSELAESGFPVVMPKAFYGVFFAGLFSFLQGFIPLALAPIIVVNDSIILLTIACMTLAFCFRLYTKKPSFPHLCLFCLGLLIASSGLPALLVLVLGALCLLLSDHLEFSLLLSLALYSVVSYTLSFDLTILLQNSVFFFILLFSHFSQIRSFFKGQKSGLSHLVDSHIRS